MGLIDQERNFLQKRNVLKVLFLNMKFLVVIYLNTRIIIFVNPFNSPVIPTRLYTPADGNSLLHPRLRHEAGHRICSVSICGFDIWSSSYLQVGGRWGTHWSFFFGLLCAFIIGSFRNSIVIFTGSRYCKKVELDMTNTFLYILGLWIL